MGLTISCRKTKRSIDMGSGGFFRLRMKVAELTGDPWASHYAKLSRPPLFEPERKHFFDAFDQETEELLKAKAVPVQIVDFCLQSDVEGKISYTACKQLYQVVKDYDDNICYGYAARLDCAKFADFKAILEDCINNKCGLEWH